ncbi:NB-ARC domain-containing protein [Lentzea sp. NPDC059081]|uniref:NB-ARC domain-containing protein n=1 Tax=Lentzea sp. NPDC059081 TaxID=3346719 RepID=UPI0036B0C77B
MDPARPSVVNEVSHNSGGTVVQAGTVHGGVHVHQTWLPGTPRQLPPSPAHFTGREPESAVIMAVLAQDADRSGPGLAVVTGTGGVGKTALALHVLHAVNRRFPDGQLYADMSAHGPYGPATPGELLGRLLLGLGVPSGEVPADHPSRAALYRSLTADREMVVFLDDAATSTQVIELLPASRRSAVIVTSRKRLSGLVAAGGRLVALDALAPEAAVELLGRAVGRHRVREEPQPAHDVAALCGGMPIAVHIVAARLAARPRWRLATIAAQLTDEHRRLRALVAEDGELSVAATFDLSYRGLTADAARLYRRLGLFPGVEFDPESAAALLGDADTDVDDLLDTLLGANLVMDSGPERFRFHDLLRLHARRQAERDDSESERWDAVRALVESLLDRAVAADQLVTPLRPHLGERYRITAEPPFTGRSEALDWLEHALPNLVACARTAFGHGWYELVWQLYEAMWGVFLYRGHTDEWRAVGTIAVDAAVRCGDGIAEVRMTLQHAAVHSRLRDPDSATSLFEQALTRAQQERDWEGEATAREGLGAAAHARGDMVTAIDQYGQSLTLNRRHGRQRGVALLLCYLGHALADTGEFDGAVTNFRSSAWVADEIGDRHCWAQAVVGAGTCLAATGAMAEAITEVRAGLSALPADEAASLRLPVLEKLADLEDEVGATHEAHLHRQEALRIAISLGDRRAESLRLRLEPESRQAG